MNANTRILYFVLIVAVQQALCYFSLSLFDFVYLYQKRVDSGGFDMEGLSMSFKSVFLFVVYFLYVLGPLVAFNLLGLFTFFKLCSKHRVKSSYLKCYHIASSSILVSYLSALFTWFFILAYHGFKEYFPDNSWRGIYLILTPVFPGMQLYLLLGNCLFYSLFVPCYIWWHKR